MTHKQLLGFVLFWVACTLVNVILLKDDNPTRSWWDCLLSTLKGWVRVIFGLGLIWMFLYGLALMVGLA